MSQGRPSLPSREEYERRIAALRQLLDAQGVDAALAYASSMRPGPLLYLSGYVPTNGFACLYVTSDSATLLTDQAWDVGRARETLWLNAEAIRPSVDFGADLGSLRGAVRRLGVIGWEIMPATLADRLRRDGDAVELVDIGAAAASARMVKSAEEVALLREACRITSEGAAALAASATPDVTERQLAATIESAMRTAGSGPLAFPLVLGSGAEQTSSAVPLPGNRALASGDMVLLDCGATYHGYCGDLARTLVVGKPSAKQRRLLETAHDIFLQCAEDLRPGVRAADVHARATSLAAAAGHELPFLLGHGIGCQNWEPPLLGKDDSTVFEAGMVVTLEPGLYVEELGGVRLENTFLITEAGAEALTFGPIDLWNT